jgi:hypothetical protein
MCRLLLLAAWTELLSADDLGLRVIKLLAVLGGAFLGALFSGLFVQLMVRGWLKKQVPHVILTGVRTVGALAVGGVVWLFAFSGGGGGTGWLPGGSGGPASGDAGGPVVADRDTARHKPEEKPHVTDLTPPKSEVIRVEMLGGERYHNDQRFYRIDDKRFTLSELLDELQKRREAQPALKGIDIVIYEKGSVAESHPAVLDLKKRALDLELAVTTTKPGIDAP